LQTNHLNTKQVFEAKSRTRWLSILWTFRVVFALLAILISIFIYGIFQKNKPQLPKLNSIENNLESENYSTINRKKISKTVISENKTAVHKNNINAQTNFAINKNSERAAFYVPWDPLSFNSLYKNINRLNCIIPEWFQLDKNSNQIKSQIDEKGYVLMKALNKKIIPILSNNDGVSFNEKIFENNCSTPTLRKKCIKNIVQLLNKFHFQGINIDFEEISLKNKNTLNLFQKELYETLNPMGYEVSMDVPVFNNNYDYKTLQLYNDKIYAMAYDENNAASEAGPIAEQQWIEDAIDDLKKDIPKEKIVLCMPTYGYEWIKNETGKPITYYEALAICKQNNQLINFDNNNYNLDFSFEDTINNTHHEIYFTDACTNFNNLRYAEDNGLLGVGIWRLGSEDPRLWDFYNDRLDKQTVKRNINKYKSIFKKVTNFEGVSYIGKGDILDVLSVPETGKISIEIDTNDYLISEQNYEQLPAGFVVKKFGSSPKKIVLTFDDGPDETYTPKIMDILKKENVPATFFVVGLHVQDNMPIVEEMYKQGFEIGNHTLTHTNMSLASDERAVFETTSTRKLIEIITGHSTILFRAPYNADSQPETQAEMIPIARSKKENYYTIAESIDPTDWKEGSNADSIYDRVMAQLKNGNIILLHDAGGNRNETILALPKIIKQLKKDGYTFTTVADLLGKTKEEVMPTVALDNSKIYWNMKTSYWVTKGMYFFSHTLSWLFLIGVLLSGLRSIFMMLFAGKNYFSKSKKLIESSTQYVSILIPAYNEEVNIIRTIDSVLNSTFTNYEIIIIDDGSTDGTLEKIKSKYEHHNLITILHKINGGKASALNRGLQVAKHEIIICLDADSQLKEDAIAHLMQSFYDEKIGAVAGNVVVGNEINMLTRWQNIEYITSQNFDRRAFDELNCITVVPGAIGAFRKKAIAQAGFYTSDTLAEDCDLSIRILKEGYKIVNNSKAISYTEAPETFKMFLKQRFRWNFGIMQAFWKNKKILFNKKYGSLGMIAMPNILIFQILLPILAPFADLVLLWAIFNGNSVTVIQSYLLFTLVDLVSAIIAFSFQKENLLKLIWIIPQRLIYRQLMYYILFKSVHHALKGEIQGWGKLERTGRIAIK
jgi:peptidoglycan-N-acetylglucosamine deacetylase